MNILKGYEFCGCRNLVRQMGKKRSWFAFVKRLFIFDSKSKAEKKPKRWRWMFGRFKFRQYPEIEAPQKTLSEATEEQRKHVLAVAIATAAAAEAAVASANAAAEVVRLTQAPSGLGKQCRNLAAVRIQSAYRRHLARKALNALRGVVKLQAMIRGEIARRRMITKLKFITSLAFTSSRVYQLRVDSADENRNASEKRQILVSKEMMRFPEIELECNKHRNWDRRLVSKEDLETLWLRKQEAIVKRERMKKYSFSHRERRNDQFLEVALTNDKHARQSSYIDQWTEVEKHRKPEAEKLTSFLRSQIIAENASHVARLKLRNACEQDSEEGFSSPFSLPRRSFGDIKQKSIGDVNSLPNSPIFPTYMAATQSAKAKTRSLSTPKQRLILSDACSGPHSPHKLSLSSWSSFNGEITSSERKSRISQHRYSNLGGLT